MKNKIILLVSMLLPLISGCGEKPTAEPTVEPTLEPTIEPTLEPTVEPTQEIINNYNESEYSETLNYVPYLPADDEWPTCDVELSNLLYGENQVLFQHNGDYDEHYTCAYISDVDAKFISETSVIPYDFGYNDLSISRYFAGINLAYLNYIAYKNYFRYSKKHKFNVLKWYEIPINEEIPKNINGYSLILISRGKHFDYYDLNNNYLYSKPMFIEQPNHDLYNVTFESMDQEDNLTLMKEFQISLDEKTSINKKYIINFDFSYVQDRQNGQSLYDILLFEGQEIETIDNIEYISLKYSNINKYLPDKYEYFINGEYIYYKLSDIISYIKEYNE